MRANPRAVLGRDEPGQRHAVVVRGHRREAAAADRRDAAALGLDAAARLASSASATSSSSPARTCSASAPWPASGRSSLGIEAHADLVRRARAGRARTRRARSRRARARRACAAACRCCRATARSTASARARAAARGGAPTRCRCACPGRSGVRAAERVARILALEVRADDEPVGVRRRHVLRRVHGDVDPARRAAPPRAP